MTISASGTGRARLSPCRTPRCPVRNRPALNKPTASSTATPGRRPVVSRRRTRPCSWSRSITPAGCTGTSGWSATACWSRGRSPRGCPRIRRSTTSPCTPKTIRWPMPGSPARSRRAGTVTIWDRGTYDTVKWTDREVKVVLHGRRLSGGYTVFRTRGDDWMMHRERQPLPGVLTPMLARSDSELPPDDGRWALEMKWDGVRALAYCDGGRIRLVSRTGQDVTPTYPELRGLGSALDRRQALLDGEVVALGDAGWPDFEALQPRMHVRDETTARRLAAQYPVTYLAFDVLHLDGRPLLDLPYSQRRALLEGLALDGPYCQVPPSFIGEPGAGVKAVSEQHGLEGVVAKRLDSRYEPGKRSGSWRKVKNMRRQEAVIGGWRPGKGNRTGLIGSLLVGVQEPDGLAYAGHVGTGFTDRALRLLTEKLAPLRRDTSPFATPLPADHARDAVWAEPVLVAEVAFTGWTKAGRMRAPSYQGLRTDKDPAEVIREP